MTASTIPASSASDHTTVADSGGPWMEDCGVTVHAVLPPPLTGMTICTAAAADALARRVPVRRYNWSNGSSQSNPWFLFVKAMRALTTPVRLLFGSRPRRGVFYMPANAGLAVVFNLLALSAARLGGYRCVLHHHFFRYVDNFEWRIQLLTWVLGPNGLQIVLCPAMERKFRMQYGQSVPLAIVPSTIQLLQVQQPVPPDLQNAPQSAGPFVLGHMTHLRMMKGLDIVFDVFRELRRQGRDVRLILAGPTYSDVQGMIPAAQAEFGDRLEYRGPVYGADKHTFYDDIHLFVYPTRLDAQPLVVMESFSHGRPILSYGRGCIPDMLPRTEWSICPKGDFVQPAVQQIVRWLDDPSDYADACRLARQSYDAALVDAREAMDDFIHWVCCEPDHGFVRRGESTSSPAETTVS